MYNIRSGTAFRFNRTPHTALLEAKGLIKSKTTPSMLTGTLIHRLLFKKDIEKICVLDKTAKKIDGAQNGNIVVKNDVYQECLGGVEYIFNQIKKHKLLSNIFDNGIIEEPLTPDFKVYSEKFGLKDLEIDAKSYGTPDLIFETEEEIFIVDVKTTSIGEFSPRSWYFRSLNYGYHCQFVHYETLIKCLGCHDKKFRWVHVGFLQKSPFEGLFFEFSNDQKITARDIYFNNTVQLLYAMQKYPDPRNFENEIEMFLSEDEELTKIFDDNNEEE